MSTSTQLVAGHRAEVVIVGGGIMGASIAYHLARAGITDVIVLESGEIACGSSGKPLGGVRVQFSHRANIELGLRSLHAYGRFAEEIGKDIGLQRVGYLFALRDPADVAPFEASIALQTELGAVSRVVDADAAVALCPYLDASRLVAAAWSPGDGFARPADAVRGYLDSASALGVTVRTGTRVVGIERVGAGQALVRTADGHRYLSPAVVCATGAWSRAVGEMVGVRLPVDPLRRQIASTPPLQPAPPPGPVHDRLLDDRVLPRLRGGRPRAGHVRLDRDDELRLHCHQTPGIRGSAPRCRCSPPISRPRRSPAAGPGSTR